MQTSAQLMNQSGDQQGEQSRGMEDLRAVFQQTLVTKRREAVSGRASSGIEEEWSEDEEHYQGIDDANRVFQNANQLYNARKSTLLSGSASQSSQGTRSVIFLNITRSYVEAASARVADMLLPTDDRCWQIKPTPLPTLSQAQQQQLGAKLGVQDPAELQQMIDEQADAAQQSSIKMQAAIDDPLVESNWHGEVRQVIEDAARIGSGVLKGPFPVLRTVRLTKSDPVTGAKQFIKAQEIKPASKRISPWNFFPDPACGENTHNGSYTWERETISRRQLRELQQDDSYDAAEIGAALREGPSTVREGLEAVYRQGENEYEMWIFYGYCARDQLTVMGVELDEDDLGDDRVPTMAVMVNNRIIKIVESPQENGDFPYDVLAWQRRPGLPWGMGIARQMRTPQRMLNGSARAMMDNGGLSAAPQWIIADGITPIDGKFTLSPGKGWRAEPSASVQDVRAAFSSFVIPSVQPDLMNTINFALKMAEDCTGMPAMLQGIRGDAPDTLGGMQMQNNNATSVLRRLAKRFDDYMTGPHIQRYFDWMMMYSDDDSIKGDFEVDVRASSALVERDAQQQFLMSLLQASANPVYGLDPSKLAAELCKGQRLDPKNFQLTEEQKAQQAQQAQQPPDPTIEAKVTLLQAQAAKTQADTQTSQAQATKTMADAESAKAQAANVRMETLYSGVQTAQAIAAMPQVAPLADQLGGSTGFVDQNQGPIYPEVTQASASGTPPVDLPVNTDPMRPANPVSPEIGVRHGIETQRFDGVRPPDSPL